MANKENIRKWVAALRSGQYQQGTGQLADTSGDTTKYCCLGVACEVAVKEGVIPPGKPHGFDSLLYGTRANVSDALLPTEIRLWLGLSMGSPEVKVDGFSSTGKMLLTSLNDSYRWTFEEIADAIEAQYLPEDVNPVPVDAGDLGVL